MTYDKLKRILLIAVIPAPKQDPDKVEIKSYEILSHSKTEIIFLVEFENPKHISTQSARD